MIAPSLPILSAHLRLRAITAGDALLLHEAKKASWAQLNRWGVGNIAPYEQLTLDREREFCASRAEASIKGERFSFICFEHATDHFVGWGSLHGWPSIRTLGFWVHSLHVGKGYGTEIATALTAYAFDILKIHRVVSYHAAGNEGSRRVLEKTGFKHEGTFAAHHQLKGAFVDELHYGLLAKDWQRPVAAVAEKLPG